MPRDAEVDEEQVPLGGAHDIGWLEIAEDDGRLMVVQVAQHSTQLHADIQDFLH